MKTHIILVLSLCGCARPATGEGPAGPQGPAGPAGPGVQGPPGPAGVCEPPTLRAVVTDPPVPIDAGGLGYNYATVECADDEIVLSGGCMVTSKDARIVRSFPKYEGDASDDIFGWDCVGASDVDGASLVAAVVCAKFGDHNAPL